VTYIAEHHENLQHILVFLTVRGATPGVDIEAQVLPAGGDAVDASSGSGGDYLVVKSGAHTSLPLVLPGRTAPGKQHVRVQGAHYEIKLATLPSAGAAPADTYAVPLLDATQLATAAPTSFICASCSLPVVQSAARVREYRDLPSEHWEELVNAWMCHADQKLNAHVMKHGRGGFWPEEGQALVGGSYILFEEEAMVKHHLCPADETKVRALPASYFSSLSSRIALHRANKKTGVGSHQRSSVPHLACHHPTPRSPCRFRVRWAGGVGAGRRLPSVDTKCPR
jgi:hypothetical protein